MLSVAQAEAERASLLLKPACSSDQVLVRTCQAFCAISAVGFLYGFKYQFGHRSYAQSVDRLAETEGGQSLLLPDSP